MSTILRVVQKTGNNLPKNERDIEVRVHEEMARETLKGLYENDRQNKKKIADIRLVALPAAPGALIFILINTQWDLAKLLAIPLSLLALHWILSASIYMWIRIDHRRGKEIEKLLFERKLFFPEGIVPLYLLGMEAVPFNQKVTEFTKALFAPTIAGYFGATALVVSLLAFYLR